MQKSVLHDYQPATPPPAGAPQTTLQPQTRPVGNKIGATTTSPVSNAALAPSTPDEQSKTSFTATGRRKAFLIGINYYGTQAELAGCVNDVENISSLLIRKFGWRQSEIRTLDDDRGRSYPAVHPTRQRILESLQWLVLDAQPGDTLFLLYSGHGAQEVDPNGYEEDGMNDTILPVDFAENGMISDDVLTELCVRPLPEGCSLTCIIDACHSGTALDLPWTWQPGLGTWREDWNPFFTKADVQMFSGCADAETSSDGGRDLYGRRGGALTTAFCEIFAASSQTRGAGIGYDELLERLLQSMRVNGFSQTPQLSSSQAFDQRQRVFAPFVVQNASSSSSPRLLPQQKKICRNLNKNPEYGLVFRRKFPPQPAPLTGSPLESMLMDLGMLVLQDAVAEEIGGAVVDGLGDVFGGMGDLLGGAGDLLGGAADDVAQDIEELF
ncbi:unnamed protein product [Amoebophrya sp. A120]|nr:unnamed protein product [Amoebophrya sp. A120]|eukprot:GSA120T00001594001.1